MDLLETIEDVLEQENNILAKSETKVKSEFAFDETMFNKMANFIINLDPESLNDQQVENIINMIENLEVETDDDIQEVRNPRLARRSAVTKNAYSKKWYRKNRSKIRKRKKRFKRSSEGRKRMKMKDRLAKQGRTPTGRRKVRYHVRKRSDRKDRLKEK